MRNYNIYKKDRGIYIAEAAVEYLISIPVTGSFLAKLTVQLGFSDSLTGIITAFLSLGCAFQVACAFIPKGDSKKKQCISFALINEILFTLLYAVPLVPLSPALKTVIFVLMILTAQIFMNVINPVKIDWYMSMVDDAKRGVFTANKEIVSLIAGTVFSLLLGTTADRFEAAGNPKGYFICCAVAMFTLSVTHCLLYAFTTEEKEINQDNTGFFKEFTSLSKNKKYISAIIICAVWNIAVHISTPFYGTYQIRELGFSMTRVSVYTFIYSGVRVIFSRFWGRFADKSGFLKMTGVCVLCAAVGFGINMFTVPSNGKVFYLIYYCLYAIASAGINSALINLVFDAVEQNHRRIGIAVQKAIYGILGFLSTLCVSPVISLIQKNGDVIFGIHIYAQQVTSIAAFAVSVCLAVYIFCVSGRQAE